MSQIEFPKMRAQELRDLADRVERGEVMGLVWAASWATVNDPCVLLQKCGDEGLEKRVVQILEGLPNTDLTDLQGQVSVKSEGEKDANCFELYAGLMSILSMVRSVLDSVTNDK